MRKKQTFNSPKSLPSRDRMMDVLKRIIVRTDHFGLHANGLSIEDYRAYHSGSELGFVPFADRGFVKTCFVTKVEIPISRLWVTIYSLQPGAETSWVLVREKNDSEITYKLFKRHGDKFLSMQPREGTITDIIGKL